MEEEKKLDFINSNNENIKVEQVVQNYLIEPDFLTSNTEKAVFTLGDANLPQSEIINQNINFNLEAGPKLTNYTESLTDISGDTEKTINLLQQIPFFKTDVTKVTTPGTVFEKSGTPSYVTKKELQNVITQINSTVNPALQNLYTSVSAVMEKGKDPKGFTELRPTYNGDMFFFSDELNRVSQKFIWS
jgi:hypothetical protein